MLLQFIATNFDKNTQFASMLINQQETRTSLGEQRQETKHLKPATVQKCHTTLAWSMFHTYHIKLFDLGTQTL